MLSREGNVIVVIALLKNDAVGIIGVSNIYIYWHVVRIPGDKIISF